MYLNQDRGAPRTPIADAPRAIARGVFGSPFFVAEGESFWGNDRLGEVDAWLGTGGWWPPRQNRKYPPSMRISSPV